MELIIGIMVGFVIAYALGILSYMVSRRKKLSKYCYRCADDISNYYDAAPRQGGHAICFQCVRGVNNA